ncbi:uncharacterized protein LY89DRAFT_663918 [Mollisia scopiformis]|uniref:2EXR domain-containing protein n=1 Tax=Mollisia scopiformis TaxID=149040 RepID=A0A194XT54_MOLSC|nr:uncharacterized protein LY89DRAFT_663918 [Mollisia scopiformis]KUJ23490.1 hypothetical protein LY89DRAFT_663918 [Mollisia scopiformis]
MASTFHSFGRLPVELRFHIWNDAFPLFPRIFELVSHDEEPGDHPATGVSLPNCNLRVNRSPTLLLVNRKARAELLPRYSLNFNPRVPGPFVGFCPSIDMLYLTFPGSGPSRNSTSNVFRNAFGNDYDSFKCSVKYLFGLPLFWPTFLFFDGTEQLSAMENLKAFVLLHDGPNAIVSEVSHDAGFGFKTKLKGISGIKDRLMRKELKELIAVHIEARAAFK